MSTNKDQFKVIVHIYFNAVSIKFMPCRRITIFQSEKNDNECFIQMYRADLTREEIEIVKAQNNNNQKVLRDKVVVTFFCLNKNALDALIEASIFYKANILKETIKFKALTQI